MKGIARVAAAVPACTIADPAANEARTLGLWQQAHAEGAHVVVFPELGLTVSIHDCWDRNGRDDVCVTAAPVGGVGFRYHFAPPRVAFVARINWPVGLQLGLTF